jgi:hypothetical protein
MGLQPPFFLASFVEWLWVYVLNSLSPVFHQLLVITLLLTTTGLFLVVYLKDLQDTVTRNLRQEWPLRKIYSDSHLLYVGINLAELARD